jgi:hypothetical protein
MEKRQFGQPPSSGSGTLKKEPLKSELYTRIGTRTAVITAHYEHVQPVRSNIAQGEVKLKQVSFTDVDEPIYEVPKTVTKL